MHLKNSLRQSVIILEEIALLEKTFTDKLSNRFFCYFEGKLLVFKMKNVIDSSFVIGISIFC